MEKVKLSFILLGVLGVGLILFGLYSAYKYKNSDRMTLYVSKVVINNGVALDDPNGVEVTFSNGYVVTIPKKGIKYLNSRKTR